jgi:para-nitrobenzyl esterase
MESNSFRTIHKFGIPILIIKITNMKKITTLLTILIATYSFAQDCSQGRYKEEIFSAVSVTSNIQYGSNVDYQGANTDLFLDIYEGTGDTASNRALIIMAHGGSFIGGSKTGTDVVPICESLARKGYTVASVSYRLGIAGGFFPGEAEATEAVYRAVQDGRAAVRYFRKDFVENGNSYGIDTSMIFFGGVSAGGFIALHLAYLDEDSEIPTYIDTTAAGIPGGMEGLSGNPGYSSKVTAIVNLQGAMGDKTWLTAGSIPVLNMHGDQDGTVPYNTAMLYLSGIVEIMVVDGSSSIAAQADLVGVDNCYKQFNGADHTPHVSSSAYRDTTIRYMTGFLAQFTCGDAFTCSDDALFTNISELNNNKETINVYPNPATNFITVESGIQSEATLEIYNVLGSMVFSRSMINRASTSVNIGELKPGYYFIKVTGKTGSVTQKIVIE